MAALDTNVLVRFLVRDDAAQLAAAAKLLRRCVDAGETLFVPVTVTLELERVLRSRYGFDKAVVLGMVSQLLLSFELSFEAEVALEAALAQYARNTACGTCRAGGRAAAVDFRQGGVEGRRCPAH